MGHYFGIMAGYGTAVLLFWLVAEPSGRARFTGATVETGRPLLEIGLTMLAIIGVIGIGQLYTRELLLSDRGEVRQSLNQIVIFAPILLLALWRGPFLAAMFIPLGRKSVISLALGLFCALAAGLAYCMARGLTGELGTFSASLLQVSHISLGVQVLLEDLSIAYLLSRLRNAMGTVWTIVLVAVLFQLAHIPAFLANGATAEVLMSLFIDTGIGLAVFGTILMRRNILWFWPVHTVLDLAQFYTPGT